MDQPLLSPALAPTRRIKCSIKCVCAKGDECNCKCNGANHKSYDPALIQTTRPRPARPRIASIRKTPTAQTPTLFKM